MHSCGDVVSDRRAITTFGSFIDVPGANFWTYGGLDGVFELSNSVAQQHRWALAIKKCKNSGST